MYMGLSGVYRGYLVTFLSGVSGVVRSDDKARAAGGQGGDRALRHAALPLPEAECAVC